MPKITPKARLIKKLWTNYVSPYIRQRDSYRCFTCGNQLDKYTSDAGHFIPRSSYSDTMYDETNLHCQCAGCNTYRHGNLTEYTVKMIEMYGIDHVNSLRRRRDIVKRWKVSEIEDLIEYYKDKLNTL